MKYVGSDMDDRKHSPARLLAVMALWLREAFFLEIHCCAIILYIERDAVKIAL